MNNASYFLAQAVHYLRPTSSPRGQIVTWHDTWYPQAKNVVDRLRELNDAGVLMSDQILRDCGENE